MQIKRKIEGETWIFKIVGFKEMAKFAGDDDTCGLCVSADKTVYIREDAVDYSTIAHEIYHAYFSYLCLASTSNISFSDSEEIHSDHFALKGEIMIKTAKKVTKSLQRLMEEK